MAEESMKDFERELEESYKNMNRYDEEDSGKWDNFKRMLEEKEIVNVKIAEAVKGGCIAYIDEVRGFIPASKLSSEYVEDLNTFLNKNIDVVVITVEPEKKKLVLSHREIEEAQKQAKRDEAFAKIKEGDVFDAKVESIKDYGVFVELSEGVSGLLHISQISHTRVKNPAAVFKPGDEVKVKVTGIKDGKISVSKKALESAPGDFRNERSDRHEERDAFNYKQTGAIATNLGALLKDLKIK